MSRRVHSLRFVLLALVLFVASCGDAHASDSDLQQYSRVAATVESACGSNPLTSSLLFPVDGKQITADNNAAGKAPVNRGLKQLADYATCVRCMFTGACAGVNLRTAKALEVDGTGGNVSTAAAGTIVASASRSGTTLPTTANPQGVHTKDSPIFGFANFTWNGASYVFTGGFNVDGISRTAAGTVVVTFATAPANYLKCSAVGGGFFNSGGTYVADSTPSAPVAGKMPVTVYIRSVGGGALDGGFSVLVFCGA